MVSFGSLVLTVNVVLLVGLHSYLAVPTFCHCNRPLDTLWPPEPACYLCLGCVHERLGMRTSDVLDASGWKASQCTLMPADYRPNEIIEQSFSGCSCTTAGRQHRLLPGAVPAGLLPLPHGHRRYCVGGRQIEARQVRQRTHCSPFYWTWCHRHERRAAFKAQHGPAPSALIECSCRM